MHSSVSLLIFLYLELHLNQDKMKYKPLNKDLIQKALERIFSQVIILEEIDSTNEFAKRVIKEGINDKVLIIAEEQTSGKGRMGRRWFSQKYANLLFSLILSPKLDKKWTFSINMALAISLIEAIKEDYKIDAMIKWPNDIYIGNKKLAGILTELFLDLNIIKHMIIGMGINVNWAPEDKTLLYPATSLAKEKGEYIDRETILISILTRFDNYYKKILTGEVKELYKKWNDNCMIIGKEISIVQDKEIRGVAVKIKEDGSLVILKDGKEKTIMYGDVSLR